MKKIKKLLSGIAVAHNYLILSFLIMLACSFSFATYIPFLVHHAMNLWQINVINSCFMATIIIMEMPTGSFADKFGRHRSITLSCFLLALATLIYFFRR
jgi:MFS family permease